MLTRNLLALTIKPVSRSSTYLAAASQQTRDIFSLSCFCNLFPIVNFTYTSGSNSRKNLFTDYFIKLTQRQPDGVFSSVTANKSIAKLAKMQTDADVLVVSSPLKTKPKQTIENNEEQSEKNHQSSVNEDIDEELENSEELEKLEGDYLSAKAKSESKWLSYKKTCFVYLYRGGGEPNETIAAFDIDGTIIKPKSNKKIPKSATDWQFFSVWTKVKLQQVLRENKARFVLFTNQNGIGLGIVPLEEVQERIELIAKRLDIPCTVFMAVDKDIFRKPEKGMFRLFQDNFNDKKLIDLEKSFYCGDAVGYPSHSDADIKFAQSIGIPFLTPEKFLRGVKPKLVI